MELGTELTFNETSFSTSMKKWDKLLVPVNEAILYFNELGMGEVDNIIWDKMRSNKIEELREAYHKFIAAELKRSKQTLSAILRSSVQAANEEINILQDMVNKFHQVRDFEDSYSLSGNMQLDFENISIVDGCAILTKESIEKIRKTFCITIENENQIKFHSLAEHMKSAYEALRTFYKEHSPRAVEDHVNIIDSQALLYEQNGRLHFVEEFIPDIK